MEQGGGGWRREWSRVEEGVMVVGSVLVQLEQDVPGQRSGTRAGMDGIGHVQCTYAVHQSQCQLL